jgi:hypothetical protein
VESDAGSLQTRIGRHARRDRRAIQRKVAS